MVDKSSTHLIPRLSRGVNIGSCDLTYTGREVGWLVQVLSSVPLLVVVTSLNYPSAFCTEWKSLHYILGLNFTEGRRTYSHSVANFGCKSRHSLVQRARTKLIHASHRGPQTTNKSTYHSCPQCNRHFARRSKWWSSLYKSTSMIDILECPSFGPAQFRKLPSSEKRRIMYDKYFGITGLM